MFVEYGHLLNLTKINKLFLKGKYCAEHLDRREIMKANTK